MDPGRLDQHLTLQRPVETDDGAGGKTVTWADVALRLPAAVDPVGAREAMRAGRLESQATYRVTIRNRAVDPSWRFLWASRGDAVLAIVQAPDPGGRALWRELVCESGVPT